MGSAFAAPPPARFERITSADGLPNDIIYSMLVDNSGRLWTATSNGMGRLDPSSGEWKHYTVADGLQSMVFRQGAAHVGPGGRFYFGGLQGYNSFVPAEVKGNTIPPPVVITSLKINEVEQLATPLTPAREVELRLNHRQNYVVVEFAALDYTNPRDNEYAYKLDGIDDDWIYSGHRRVAAYAHLDPGRYTLRVKGSNNDGVWNEAGVSIALRILPPLWRTGWAYAFYAAIIVLTVWAIRRRELNRIRLAGELRLQKIEAEKLREVDEAKSRFFANISHEFRTPLTLILGPLERLRARWPGDEVPAEYGVMGRNARRLLNLIDQILDLSKIEAAGLALDVREVDLRNLARISVASFAPYAASRAAWRFTSMCPTCRCRRVSIPSRWKSAVNNLLSNAVKFTPSEGSVTVTVKRDTGGAEGDRACIAVADTGAGIAFDLIDRVFDRFVQGDGQPASGPQGTGIGLGVDKGAGRAARWIDRGT